ncbi:MAG: hypothetical protein AAF830_00875 [Pseudomonadota bacterium]
MSTIDDYDMVPVDRSRMEQTAYNFCPAMDAIRAVIDHYDEAVARPLP